MMSSRHLLTVGASLLAAATALAACGIPTGPDSLEDISTEVPSRIADTTTTSTTTTTTTLPQVTVSTQVTTTTELVLAPAPVEVFFLSGDDLVGVTTFEEPPIEPNLLTSLLEQGPASELRDTLIEPGLILSVEISGGGLVTIDLDDNEYRELGPDRTQAIGQIVLTFLVELTAVGTATFTVDGEQVQYPKGNGLFTTEPVAIEDYFNLIADGGSSLPSDDIPTSTTTSSTTTTTSTTVAPTTTEEPPDTSNGDEPPTTDESTDAATNTEAPDTTAADS